MCMSMAGGPDWQGGETGFSKRRNYFKVVRMSGKESQLLPAWHIHHRFLLSQGLQARVPQHREED